MKREKAFSKDGFYRFVLDSNLMLHEHVAKVGQQYLSKWLGANPDADPVNVLDLACGGVPVSICRMMAACPQRRFRYTGVDLNPDQVEAANRFAFPDNVVATHIKEGNAWELSSLDLDERYDIIFSGMNLHHGTPEEIDCLMQQCKRFLSKSGLFINHDFYRPDNLPYLRRPDFNPRDQTESYAMVSAQTLSGFKRELSSAPADASQSDWRHPFLLRYIEALRGKGAAEACIEELETHVMGRDFPISTAEMRQIANGVGFDLTVADLHASDQPLGGYFSLVIASPCQKT